MLHLNIYLPPYTKDPENHEQTTTAKIKNEAIRLLKNNSNSSKNLNRREENDSNSKVLIRPKLYELTFVKQPKRSVEKSNRKPDTFRSHPKVFKTNFDLIFSESIELNSDSTQFTDIQDFDFSDFSDSNIIEKTHLDLYENTLDIGKSHTNKNSYQLERRYTSIPLLSERKNHKSQCEHVKRELKLKNVSGYNILGRHDQFVTKSPTIKRNEIVKSRINSNENRSLSSKDKSGEKWDSNIYYELIKDRKLHFIDEKLTKYLNFFNWN